MRFQVKRLPERILCTVKQVSGMGQSRACLSRGSPGNMPEMRVLEEEEVGGAEQQISHGEFSPLVVCVDSQLWTLPSFLRFRLRVLKPSHRALRMSFPSRKAANDRSPELRGGCRAGTELETIPGEEALRPKLK